MTPIQRPGITFLAVTVITALMVPSGASPALATACSVTVHPGQSIQAAISAVGPGATVCIGTGTYTITSTIRPADGQQLVGTVNPRPRLLCDVAICVDGYRRSSNVAISNLRLVGAYEYDLRTGNGWTVTYVTAASSHMNGVQIKGTGVTLRNVRAHDNGRFGIYGASATQATVIGARVFRNPSDPSYGSGRSGGMKFVVSSGVTVRGSRIVNNGGGAALWLDIDTRNFVLENNVISSHAADGIRVEIACNGVVANNRVGGNTATAQIDLFNANHVTVLDNRVSVPPLASYGLRILGNGRPAPQGAPCGTSGVYENVANQATGNTIVMHGGAMNGVYRTSGITQDIVWSDNTYQLASCASTRWKWWSGSSPLKLTFSQWQHLGQDAQGSCS